MLRCCVVGRRSVILAATSLAVIGCTKDAPVDVSALLADTPRRVGCFSLEWTSLTPGMDTLFDVPDSILLSPAELPLDARFGPRRWIFAANAVRDLRPVQPGDSATYGWYRVYNATWWQPLPADSVHLFFTDQGYVWWSVRLRQVGDSLRGRGWMDSDWNTAEAAVSGARIVCPESAILRE